MDVYFNAACRPTTQATHGLFSIFFFGKNVSVEEAYYSLQSSVGCLDSLKYLQTNPPPLRFNFDNPTANTQIFLPQIFPTHGLVFNDLLEKVQNEGIRPKQLNHKRLVESHVTNQHLPVSNTQCSVQLHVCYI